MRRVCSSSRREPTIALINIVFLMLVFFMVAGTLAQPLDTDLKLVSTADLEGRPPPDALVVHADGRLSYRGFEIASATEYMESQDAAAQDVVRLVPDRELPAQELVKMARSLRDNGAKSILVVTERALQ
ncbi:MAG: biopolymer transporter ExbD [Roseovarius sp.]|nr:biopolymer transporter ExbD [Roseovarius sp.]